METYKKDDAFMLYTEGNMPLNEIATLLNVHINTLSKWANAGKWNDIAENHANMHTVIRTALMRQCDRILEDNERNEREMNKREAEMIRRLGALSKRRNGCMNYTHHMATLTKFTKYIMHTDLPFATELIKYLRTYLKQFEDQEDTLRD